MGPRSGGLLLLHTVEERFCAVPSAGPRRGTRQVVMPDRVTRLLLIRHAHTEPGERLCGSFDVPLSARGREQVETLLTRRPQRPAPDALYSSPLTRARDVAATLARVWKLEPRLEDAAREIHCGDVEGEPLQDLRRRYPDLWARNCAQEDSSFAWPGGESYAEFRARIVEGLAQIAARHAGQRVAVITHAGVVSQVLGAVHGRSPAEWERDRPEPFTATELTWTNGSPGQVLSYNDPDWY